MNDDGHETPPSWWAQAQACGAVQQRQRPWLWLIDWSVASKRIRVCAQAQPGGFVGRGLPFRGQCKPWTVGGMDGVESFPETPTRPARAAHTLRPFRS
jgi:hypothetical protein